ncbi:MAG: GTPase domain-containing protein [Planctomycetes bacterium]|nr:GTPase domain-containing protein [Planctomycetota bacterium]
MVQINFGQREVSCKVVFYGPGMSGKTTNLEIIHKKAPKDAVGEMVSIATETDRTLYFDFLPLDLGQVAGMRTKFQLYTVPGQIYYNATRKLVLQGVDGVIFVADSNPDKMAENLESLQNLRDNLAEMNLTIEDVPLVIQYNKRDLPNALSVADLNAQLNPTGVPTHEGVAREGKGVFATLKEISRLVIEKLNKEHAPAANRRRTNTALGAAPSATPTAAPAAVPPSAAPAHTPMAQQRLPQSQRPAGTQSPPMAMPQSRPPMPAQPTPARGMPQLQAPAQQHAQHAQSQADPRDKHLAKAKPPSLDNLKQQPAAGKVNLGATDPSLKRYQEASRPGGGGVKTLLIVLIGLIVLMIMAVVAVIYVPAVRSLLPQDMQRALIGPSTTEPAKPAPAPAPAPAGEKPAPPDETPAPAEKPAEPAAEKPAEKPGEKPAEPAAEKPAETTPAPAPADKPAEGANGQ